MALTIEQQRAIAIADAKARAEQSSQQPPPQTTQPEPTPTPITFGGAPVGTLGPTGAAVLRKGVEGVASSPGGLLGDVLGTGANIAGQLLDPYKKFSLPEVGQAAATDWVPMNGLAKMGGRALLEQGIKMAGASTMGQYVKAWMSGNAAPNPTGLALGDAAAISAPVLGKGLDAGTNAAEVALKSSADAGRRAAIRMGRDIGLFAMPSAEAPGLTNNFLSQMAGKPQLSGALAERNDLRAKMAIADDLSLKDPEGATAVGQLTPIGLNTAKSGPNATYNRIGSADPEVQSMLDSHVKAMQDVNKLKDQYRTIASGGGNPNGLLPNIAQQQGEADAAWDLMAEKLKDKFGKEQAATMLSNLNDAKKQLAKISMAERATKGNGVDLGVFSDALAFGDKLDSNYYKLAQFDRFTKDSIKPLSATTSGDSFVNNLMRAGRYSAAGTAGALAGAAGGHPAIGALAGTAAMTAGETGAKKILMSPFYQNSGMMNRNYGKASADLAGNAAARTAMLAGQGVPGSEEPAPLSKAEQDLFDELSARYGKQNK